MIRMSNRIPFLLSWEAQNSFCFYWTQVRSLATHVSDWLTHSCLVALIDVTLAFQDANSKLVDVVTVADEETVDDSLV